MIITNSIFLGALNASPSSQAPTAFSIDPRLLRWLAGTMILALQGCGDFSLGGKDMVKGSSSPQSCFKRHVIDASSSGADGVHLGDINKDGFMDVVSGWEEGSKVKVYLHPGTSSTELQAPWPQVEVSGLETIADIEDAAFADLDLDNRLDTVISATEGDSPSEDNHRIRIHRFTGPLLDPDSWQSNAVYLDEPTERFMKVRSAQIDGKHGADIVALSRNLEDGHHPGQPARRGGVFLFTAPTPEQITLPEAWQRQRLADIKKGKSIELADIDGDGDSDILYAGTRKVRWLENPANEISVQDWKSHRIGAASDLALCDINNDGIEDVVATAGRRDFPVVAKWFQGTENPRTHDQGWQQHDIRIDGHLPTKFYQWQDFALKSISCGHFQPLDDATPPIQLMLTASGTGYGVFLVSAPANGDVTGDTPWRSEPVSEYKYVMKYDNILATDTDSDGDMDFVTTEENEGLTFSGAGVVWFENTPCGPVHGD